ncbi:MAG: hypothetical protein ACI39U_08475, partial [Candidatus Cryptobacteroides sp.]
MEKYKADRERQRRNSTAGGLVLTVLFHIVMFVCMSFTGLVWLDPPPPEREDILIDFSEDVEVRQPEQKYVNQSRLKSPEPDRTKKEEAVKMSEAQYEGRKENVAKEATVGPEGDVEVKEPEREVEINRRALFHAAKNPADKDTLAAQTAYTPGDKLSEGHAMGNVVKGRLDGEPNVHIEGRSTVGALKKPAYNVQKEGTVVVSITVNQAGQVIEAIPGGKGTTVSDRTLWNEARKAA